MEKVADYTVVTGRPTRLNSTNALRVNVLELISEGWEPIGGVAWDGTLYLQAMVKRERE
ncbi:MAG TPA: hypothetical protein VE913_24810 [Longimicrobium sp.]|nr:hypothetical protein [Longimicrobium sp.]